MRFLVDNALSPVFARILQDHGHDSVHIRDYELQAAPDSVVLDRAVEESRIVISADTDFGTLLSNRRTAQPSVVLFRGKVTRRPESLAELLLSNVNSIEQYLSRGAIVAIEPSRIRVRELPVDERDVP